jgi:hypothetical protein
MVPEVGVHLGAAGRDISQQGVEGCPGQLILEYIQDHLVEGPPHG